MEGKSVFLPVLVVMLNEKSATSAASDYIVHQVSQASEVPIWKIHSPHRQHKLKKGMEQTSIVHCQMLIFKEQNLAKRDFITLAVGKTLEIRRTQIFS